MTDAEAEALKAKVERLERELSALQSVVLRSVEALDSAAILAMFAANRIPLATADHTGITGRNAEVGNLKSRLAAVVQSIEAAANAS